MKQFFITINETQPKNNLDKMLQMAFEHFSHKLINEPNIDLLKRTYTRILQNYKDNKGKCHIDFSMSTYDDTIFITMGSTLQVTLIKVLSTI